MTANNVSESVTIGRYRLGNSIGLTLVYADDETCLATWMTIIESPRLVPQKKAEGECRPLIHD